MLLPTSRNVTLNPSDPIPSALLDDLQDCIIGTKKPTTIRPQMPAPYAVATSFNLAGGGAAPVYLVSNAVSANVTIGLFCETGDRITSCSYRALGNGVVDCTASLYVCASDMVTTTLLGTFVDNNRAAAWGEVTIPVTPHVMAAGEFLYLYLIANAALYQVGRILTGYDRL